MKLNPIRFCKRYQVPDRQTLLSQIHAGRLPAPQRDEQGEPFWTASALDAWEAAGCPAAEPLTFERWYAIADAVKAFFGDYDEPRMHYLDTGNDPKLEPEEIRLPDGRTIKAHGIPGHVIRIGDEDEQ